MDNSLKNRYIYAVVRHLPTKMQSEVEQELDAIISEMTDQQRDIKDVLLELGNPEELALKYHGGGRKALISGVYYLMYKRVLMMVMPIAAIAILVMASIGLISGTDTMIYILFVDVSAILRPLQIFTVTAGALLQIFTVITLVFAVLEYFNISLRDDEIADLPDVPEARARISPLNPIWGIVWSIGFAILILGFPEIIRGYFDGQWVEVLNVAAVRALWFPLIAWTVIETALEIFKLVEGRYTKRLATVAIVASLAMAGFAIRVFGDFSALINPAFVLQIDTIAQDIAGVTLINNSIAIAPIVIILGVIAYEALEIVYYAFKSR